MARGSGRETGGGVESHACGVRDAGVGGGCGPEVRPGRGAVCWVLVSGRGHPGRIGRRVDRAGCARGSRRSAEVGRAALRGHGPRSVIGVRGWVGCTG